MPLNDESRPSKELLHPYLNAILDLNPMCPSIFQIFYMQYFSFASDNLHEETMSNFFVLPHLQPDVSQAVDQAGHTAEKSFWSILQVVRPQRLIVQKEGFWMGHSVDNTNEQEADW